MQAFWSRAMVNIDGLMVIGQAVSALPPQSALG
jgi:hypothetical protein